MSSRKNQHLGQITVLMATDLYIRRHKH